MIIKSFEIEKKFKENKIFLFYGINEGLKKEKINFLKSKNPETLVLQISEKEILDNEENFFNIIQTKSFFDNEKIIIVENATDKFLKIISQINLSTLEDIIIIRTGNLDKKSKLRNFFEKEKEIVCTPFYADTAQDLIKFSLSFIKQEKMLISQANINYLIERCGGDREILKNELHKIKTFSNGKQISFEDIQKLTNLVENHDISILIDNCLIKNKKKTIEILNENNFSSEDSIIIIKIFSNKIKKILRLCKDYEKNKDLEKTISNSKPPIFWKDKEIVKQQIYKWDKKKIENLIFYLNDVELEIKKNINNSIQIVSNLILEICSS